MLLIMATLVVAIIFGFANSDYVLLKYFIGETELRLSILLISAFLCGLLLGVLLDAWILIRQRSRIRTLEKSVEATRTELSNLRNLPLKDLEQ